MIAGKYSYRLRQFDLDGNSKYSEVRAVEVEGPLSFELSQNFPNPFNPTTEINYQIAQTNLVMLKLYDVLGNEIQTIVNEVQKTGSYSVTINTHNLASGTYFYKLESGKFIKVRKMLLIK